MAGIDVASNLVEAGNKRASEAGLKNLKFEEGDHACHLDGVADNSFDLTLTVFGAMFAPKPSDIGEGNGAGDEAGRCGRDGQLDSRRSDIRGAAAEDQARAYTLRHRQKVL